VTLQFELAPELTDWKELAVRSAADTVEVWSAPALIDNPSQVIGGPTDGHQL